MNQQTFFSATCSLLIFILFSCHQESKEIGTDDNVAIEGLWLVTKVTAGPHEVTPIQKWARFNADGTQELYHLINDPYEGTDLMSGSLTSDEEMARTVLSEKALEIRQ